MKHEEVTVVVSLGVNVSREISVKYELLLDGHPIVFVSLFWWVWKTVDNFGVEELVESDTDGISDSHVVETLEVSGRKPLETDSDVSLVLSTMSSFEVGAVSISDVDSAVLLTLKEDERAVSPEEEVAREILPDRVCSLGKKKGIDVITTVISQNSGSTVVSMTSVW